MVGDIRSKIASLVTRMGESPIDTIVDIPAGHGYLAAEFAKLLPASRLLGVGLPSDIVSYNQLRRSEAFAEEVWSRIDYLCSDAMYLPIRDNSCDLVVNFLGLEDIKMTRGEEGVRQALAEMVRVVKPSGLVQISVAEYGDLPEERIAEEVWKSTGLNVDFAPRDWYAQVLESANVKCAGEDEFLYPKKMTAEQAKEELRFACEKTPRTFFSFGVSAISFEKLWSKHGEKIEKHGMAYWSRIRVILFQKA
ncbi:MAG: class I SAM-dependent methyltransferase [Candidatus Thorarchaeota archaeon]